MSAMSTDRITHIDSIQDQKTPVAPLPAIEVGLYQHYKGPRYKVLGIARHSETLEALVIYHPMDGDQSLWVRPWAMFTESVVYEGRTLPRFHKIDGA
jgi:hypothetical protein